MTITEPKVEQPAHDRPQPTPRSRAQLVETPDGWVLTLTLDAATARRVRTELGRGRNPSWFAPADFEVSVAPNLVPGAPFPVSAIEILVE